MPDRRVPANAGRPVGRSKARNHAGVGSKTGIDVLGVDAELDRVPGKFQIGLVEAQRLICGDSNLFLRLWDGTNWGEPRPMRALNSKFQETSPALSGDGKLLFYTSDRPGGRGGNDIWVAKWDGAEYAWSLPLTERVNSPFDENDPAFAPDGLTLYFASNRPHFAIGVSEKEAAAATTAKQLEDVSERSVDSEIYAADIATDAEVASQYLRKDISDQFSGPKLTVNGALDVGSSGSSPHDMNVFGSAAIIRPFAHWFHWKRMSGIIDRQFRLNGLCLAFACHENR